MNKNVTIIDGEYTLRSWIELWKAGHFNSESKYVMIDAGWYDWFCKSSSLFNRLKKMAPKLLAVAESSKIDKDKMYVFFKNCCPCVGPTYDDFRICDIESGNVLFCIGHTAKGTFNGPGGWFVYDFSPNRDGTNNPVDCGTWKDVKDYFGIK